MVYELPGRKDPEVTPGGDMIALTEGLEVTLEDEMIALLEDLLVGDENCYKNELAPLTDTTINTLVEEEIPVSPLVVAEASPNIQRPSEKVIFHH